VDHLIQVTQNGARHSSQHTLHKTLALKHILCYTVVMDIMAGSENRNTMGAVVYNSSPKLQPTRSGGPHLQASIAHYSNHADFMGRKGSFPRRSFSILHISIYPPPPPAERLVFLTDIHTFLLSGCACVTRRRVAHPGFRGRGVLPTCQHSLYWIASLSLAMTGIRSLSIYRRVAPFMGQLLIAQIANWF
jgi:hypothetical protein